MVDKIHLYTRYKTRIKLTMLRNGFQFCVVSYAAMSHQGAKVISVFDVKDGYWACPLDESSIPLTAFQSECGAWVWKCLPQGLSCSGPYFHSWLTRVYRKYNIVIDQTRYRVHLLVQ